MSVSTIHFSGLTLPSKQHADAWGTNAQRALLLAGCVASAAVAAWLGEPSARLNADPELARLLRGMALIKAGLVAAALGLLMWRSKYALAPRLAVAYGVGAWLMAGATLLVWQLTCIPLAALAFHAGEFLLLFVAWRDRGSKAGRPWPVIATCPPAPTPAHSSTQSVKPAG